MPSVREVLEDFPEASAELLVPAVSVFSRSPVFVPELSPYVVATSAVTNNRSTVKKVVGAWDFKLQVDIWCGYKEERFTLFNEFFAAMTNQVTPNGVSLQLGSYHDTWARYDMEGHAFEDSEMGSQRGEWRVRIDVSAHCRAILEREEFIIQTIETNLETPNNIENDDD
jgi:hypothetical protein